VFQLLLLCTFHVVRRDLVPPPQKGTTRIV